MPKNFFVNIQIFILEKVRRVIKSIAKKEKQILYFIKFLIWKKNNVKNIEFDEDFFLKKKLSNEDEKYLPEQVIVCVCFYFKKDRLEQLKKVCHNLQNIGKKVEIQIITNGDIKDFPNYSEITKNNNKIEIHNIKSLYHPYLLPWAHFVVMREKIKNYSYSHFLYLEDDILIDKSNIIYWQKSRQILDQYNLIPQFFRVETNSNNKKIYSSDLLEKINYNKVPKLISKNKTVAFINVSNPYQGCYFYDRKLMEEYLNSPASSPDFLFYKNAHEDILIRERANTGLMHYNTPSGFFNRHVLPVMIKNKKIVDFCLIQHLGENNSINSSNSFGTIDIEDAIY